MSSNITPHLPCEGVFAIHKPPNITSAQVIRDAQSHFKASNFFKPWLDREQARKDDENHNQRQKRRSWKQRQPVQVKMGHGGTLDPMATGVLILGVGNGTKSLQDFLSCTKSYEAVVVFGAATDSYDAVGKIVGRKDYSGVTREKVEEALGKFRGKIMQKPPIFSALRVQGKRLYEYAREGKEVPVEIEERPLEVQSLEMVEWMEGGTHQFEWPEEEAGQEEKAVAEKIFHFGRQREGASNGNGKGESAAKHEPQEKSALEDDSNAGAQQEQELSEGSGAPQAGGKESIATVPREACPAPACRLRMTVTSGFYVRSLCHDLGIAMDSLGLMASLIRSRQGEFELGKNVLEYDDLEKGEDEWGPKVKGMLEEWQAKEDVMVESAGKRKDRSRSRGRADDRPKKPRRRNTSSPESS